MRERIEKGVRSIINTVHTLFNDYGAIALTGGISGLVLSVVGDLAIKFIRNKTKNNIHGVGIR